MRHKPANPDAVIAGIAARQHGVVTLTQLVQAGLSRNGVTRRVRSGRLHRVHRGVYAVGHPKISHRGRWMAAVLACGPGAVLSHRPAAELWQLLDPSNTAIDVTIPTPAGRKQRDRLRIHRSHLPQHEITTQQAIAVTTPARTLRDLKRVVGPRLLVVPGLFEEPGPPPLPADVGLAMRGNETQVYAPVAAPAERARHERGLGRTGDASIHVRSESSRSTAGRLTAATKPSRTTTSATFSWLPRAMSRVGSRLARSEPIRPAWRAR